MALADCVKVRPISTRVEKTLPAGDFNHAGAAHPHARGENTGFLQECQDAERPIPTRVEKTSHLCWVLASGRPHPHARGEN